MNCTIHYIQDPRLKPYVQYVLFNHGKKGKTVREVVSFANTNICLGILKNFSMAESAEGVKTLVKRPGITSYLSGLYSAPHRLVPHEEQDEICIDFTPLGYYRFLSVSAKKYILNEDVLQEAFGKDAPAFFENVFCEQSFLQRGLMIEKFLLSKLKVFSNPLLENALHYIHETHGEIKVSELARKLNEYEKKLHRYFTSYFDINLQEYLRIVRFRAALRLLKNGQHNFTRLAHDCSYYDQSHFIREMKYFTNLTPSQCRSELRSIDDTVVIRFVNVR
ncbi:MAG TPA: AraC family transcriptional regulator [Chitinophagaceae bacterium]|nr:AraC family transcriptional regulator [Chitinophagaceae bacterium]